VAALSNALTGEGILVSQIGLSDEASDPPTEYTLESSLEVDFIPHLKDRGFGRILTYDDMHGGFLGLWSYLIAFRDPSCASRWYANQAEVDLAIRQRILPPPTASSGDATSSSSSSPLRYFDGATIESMAYPTALEAGIFCLKRDNARYCDLGRGFDPARPNAAAASLEVRQRRDDGDSEGGVVRGVFSRNAIPRGSYVAIEEGIHDVVIPPSTHGVVRGMMGSNDTATDEASSDSFDAGGRWRKAFDGYLFGQKFLSTSFGRPSYSADSGIRYFLSSSADRGGGGNVGVPAAASAASSDKAPGPLEGLRHVVHNPAVVRNFPILQHALVAVEDIEPGDEIVLLLGREY